MPVPAPKFFVHRIANMSGRGKGGKGLGKVVPRGILGPQFVSEDIFLVACALRQKLEDSELSVLATPLEWCIAIYLTGRGARLHCAVSQSRWAQCVFRLTTVKPSSSL
ncbi:hypothetical protein TNIN_236831 [Trichonephila inaurata madagascariensis]|uniref:Uncharacterized protein n=1 Tax=Trichonephila inaurata madagascariensis TaxID=2747483 RepID=A0A8X6XJL3_9ARAC|nr:hypothetical protein TNIN_236831 [Trichonephila inaurata madagascariensis]